MSAIWQITKINNATHEVEMRSNFGGVISTIVPENCRTREAHAAHLQSLINKHETPKAIALQVIQQQYQVVIIVILLMYIIRLKFG